MPDDITYTNSSPAGVPNATKQATDEHATRGHMPIVKLAYSADGDATPITADANGLEVQLGASIPSGTNNIGDVDVLTIAAGDNNIGNVDIVTMPNVTLAAGTNTNEVVGDAAHDAAAAGNPVLIGGYASAAAPTDVAADARAVRSWMLRNGATCVQLTAAGALIAGDATNGIDVDVTRVTGTVTVDGSGVTQPVSHAALTELATAIDTEVQCDIVGALPAGTNAIGKLAANSGVDIGDVDVTSLPNVTLAAGTNTNEVVGDVAQDVAVAGNPVLIGVRASTAVPTAMSADGRAVYPWGDRLGRQVVQTGVPVGTEFSITAQYTSQQTGVALRTPAAGNRVIVTHYQIQVGGTTAGTVQLWYGASGDTTYSRGTDRAIFDGEFAPSATLKPGAIATKESGWPAAADDDVLRVTTSAAINPITFTIWGYEIA